MAADNSEKNWLSLVILATALVVWAGVLALGAFFELGADRPRHDFRKPLLVVAAMALFLAVWGLSLWNRSRRQRGK